MKTRGFLDDAENCGPVLAVASLSAQKLFGCTVMQWIDISLPPSLLPFHRAIRTTGGKKLGKIDRQLTTRLGHGEVCSIAINQSVTPRSFMHGLLFIPRV